jgi:hypothetical protein
MKTISEVILDGEDQLENFCVGESYELSESRQFPLPKGANTASLGRIMHQLQLEGQLEDVVNVIQQVEKILAEYKKDSLFYRVLFPCPWLIKEFIKKKFSENEATEPMFKYLYISWKQQLANMIYGLSMLLFCISLLTLATSASSAWIPILLLLLSLAIQVKVFEDVIENIAFTEIHKGICGVFEDTYRNHLSFVTKTLQLPLKIKEIEMNGIEKTAAEFSRLESMRCLSDLAALVAKKQATSAAEVQIISNNTRLEYLESELGIKDSIDSRKRSHEIVLSRLNNMGIAVIEMAKAVTTDDLKDREKKRDLDYQMNMINSMRKQCQEEGDNAMNNDGFIKNFEKLYEKMMADMETPIEQ